MADAAQGLQDQFSRLATVSTALGKALVVDTQAAREHAAATGDAARSVASAAGEVLSFGRQLTGLSGSITGVIQQSINAVPGVASTLTKSMQLVLIELTSAFIPAIVHVSKALQDFARWLDSQKIGQTVTDTFGMIGEWWDNALHGSKEAEHERLSEFAGEFANQASALINKEQRLRTGELKVVNEAGEDISLAEADRVKAERQRLIKAFQGLVPKEATTERRPDGSYAPAAEKGEKGKGGAGGRGVMLDAIPPGYTAQYSAVADARRQLQEAALGTSQLDSEVNRRQLEALEELVRYASSLSGGSPDLPARGDRP